MLLSLCMIVKNEAGIILNCLKSVKDVVDEMIVVDTGSSDGTGEIAESFGAKVYKYEWDDSFADARNYSLSKADGDWILIMDADDVLDPADKGKLLSTVRNSPTDVGLYCLRTLCYSGDAPNAGNVLINLNIRLIRNRMGFRYKGRIHEQVCTDDGGKGKYKIAAADIRFHHYGYLNSYIKKKDKHKRNIALIQKELDENPNDAFMLFNMGNEYLTLNAPEKALSYYMESFKKFDPEAGFSSTLLIRMIVANEYLHCYGDMIKLAKLGIKNYPQITDFEYLMADAYCRRGDTGKAVRLFGKCIKMGPAPVNTNGNAGTGTFKPHFALGEIYRQLGDLKKAVSHYRMAVKSCPGLKCAYGKMADIFILEKMPPEKIREKLMRAAGKNKSLYLILSDVFYDRRLYEQAFKLARLAVKASPECCAAYYDEGVCLFYMGQYKKAYGAMLKAGGGAFMSKSAFFRMMCVLFDGGIKKSEDVFFEKKLDDPYYPVMSALRCLLQGGKCSPLSEEYKTSVRYERPIFEVLGVLLRSGRMGDFQKALQLLNLITDDTVLLSLGKFYYKFGYYNLAYKELSRSIILTGKIDAQGVQIMKNTIAAAKAGIP